ncbi:MAG: hypothetical protein IJW44_00235 [Clostridia bacterium]|nr:hypothetical protein [Clostridia bacterium]
MIANDSQAEVRELLRQCVVPVILDHGLAAHLLALRLFLKYRITSLVCGRKKSLSDLLNPICGFFRLYRQADGRLAAEQLADLADGYGDCLFVLIPLSEEDRTILRRHGASLESRYLICNPKRLFEQPPFAGL